MKKYLALVGVGLAHLSVYAEGEPTYTVPNAVNTAIGSLESAGTAYADKILPYIVNIGLAFIGIAVVYLLFKVFKRFVGGK